LPTTIHIQFNKRNIAVGTGSLYLNGVAEVIFNILKFQKCHLLPFIFLPERLNAEAFLEVPNFDGLVPAAGDEEHLVNLGTLHV
jgi:hypothetical protein